MSNRAQMTVGIPVCNAMPWLPEAIGSLLAQTTSDFEILVIVDGGTDGSAAWLHSLRDSRLRILEQPNAGVTATLNRLLREVRTPWLVRQDADDVSYPARLEKLIAAAHRWPDAGLIYSLADYHPREHCTGRFRSSLGSPDELRSIVKSGYLLSICHSAAALNVEKARALGGYRGMPHAEDADLWWRMTLRYDVRCIPEALVGFRQNPGSVSSRYFHQQQMGGLYVQYLLLSELWGLEPRPLPEIAETLLRFLKPAALRAKESLRRFNMHRSQRKHVRSLAALLQTAFTSPTYLAQRVLDELHPAGIGNGVAPHLFLRERKLLWS